MEKEEEHGELTKADSRRAHVQSSSKWCRVPRWLRLMGLWKPLKCLLWSRKHSLGSSVAQNGEASPGMPTSPKHPIPSPIMSPGEECHWAQNNIEEQLLWSPSYKGAMIPQETVLSTVTQLECSRARTHLTVRLRVVWQRSSITFYSLTLLSRLLSGKPSHPHDRYSAWKPSTFFLPLLLTRSLPLIHWELFTLTYLLSHLFSKHPNKASRERYYYGHFADNYVIILAVLLTNNPADVQF